GCFAKILIKISFTLALSSLLACRMAWFCRAYTHLSIIRHFPAVLIFNIGNLPPAGWLGIHL
ncbi:MAG TPA: hypothetical protein PLC59_09935, partial [Bacteroidales bacterium]|nr:hypothetical protein [Bacteroidales bacterium]